MRLLTQREPDLDIAGISAAQFLAGGLPLIPLVLVAGGSTDWGRPALIAQLAYLIIGGQLLVYVGFNAALSRWPSTRVYAWTFLVPAVAVVIQALRGALPGASTTVGVSTPASTTPRRLTITSSSPRSAPSAMRWTTRSPNLSLTPTKPS
jgi:drug/metabolite transporter (DMT)-like permease